ncbi:unnamed protein product [Sphagnum compactum]
MLLDNTSRASKAAAAASTHAGRTMFSYKDVAVAQPGTHTSIWPELEHRTATTSNEKSEEPVTSEKLLPKKQTSTPMMSDSEKSGKISPEEAEVAVSKEVTADATTPMTTDLTVAQPSLDDRSETHIAVIASSYTTAAAPLIVEVLDTNVSPTSNDDSETCSLHESVEETVVAAAALSNKRAYVEMRENAEAEDEVKDSMAHDKHAAAIDDCKSSDDNKMLSAEAPSFNRDNAPVAMTPFKDGKSSPLNGLPVSLPLLSNNVTNTAAVTPIHTAAMTPLPQVRFIMAAAGPQYIMAHKPGMPIFIPPHHFGLPMLDGSQTSSLLGNGPYMAPIFAPFRKVESSQETLTEVETETSVEGDGTLSSQQSDEEEEEEEQTVVENGNDNKRMENEQIQDKESSVVETSEEEEEADAEPPSSIPDLEEEIVSDVRMCGVTVSLFCVSLKK